MKRFKNLLIIVGFAVATVLTVNVAFAQSLLIRIEEPETPSNLSSLKINFVTMDIENRQVLVKCFKQGPLDAGFSQFGSDITTIAGGDTGFCLADSSVLTTAGEYKFYATAEAGIDTSTSQTVTVYSDYTGPGKPKDFKVEYKDSCEDKVSFKTADDGGETTKVNIYRSTSKNFEANAGTLAHTVVVGSNTSASATISRPCGDKYYYGAMALDDTGNHSDIVVQTISKTETVTITVSETEETVFGDIIQAIATEGGNLPQVTEEIESGEVAGASEDGTEGDESDEDGVEGEVEGAQNSLILGISKQGWVIILFALLLVGILLLRKKKQN